jgi:hypothetical protein
VDGEQARRDFLKELQRHRLVVEEDAVAPLAGDLAPHHELSRSRLEAGFGEAAVDLFVAIEDAGHGQALGPFADRVARGARAGEEGERVDDERLAGPGLAGDDVQAGSELQVAAREHREVPDPDAAQQGIGAPLVRPTRG